MKRILKLVAAPLVVSVAFAGASFAQSDATSESTTQAEPSGGTDNATSDASTDRVQTEVDSGGSGDAASADDPLGSDDDGTSAAEIETDAEGELDTGTTASTGEENNFGNVISAIQANDTAAGELGTMSEASDIRIIRVSDIAEGESMNALDEALSQNQAGVDELRSSIEANSALTARLDEEQVQVDDVVAAETQTDGSVVLYVR